MPELQRLEFAELVVRKLAYPAGALQQRHEHGFGNITAIISGEMVETADAGEYRARSCSVVEAARDVPYEQHPRASTGVDRGS